MPKSIEELLTLQIKEDAADLHINVGMPPTLRMKGGLHPVDSETVTPEIATNYMKAITSRENQAELQKVGGTDFGFAFKDLARFRVSIFKERGNIALALRLIPYKFLTFEQVGLNPDTMYQLLTRPRGLILVVGPTGSGKTTTLASMVNWMNENLSKHIITIEDPIEYYHQHKKSVITQRELGVDVPTFAEALRRGLRQDPDIFLVGEMRDLDTIEAAITAAETGHIVFATLHTTGASRTVDRIVNAFSVAQQEQIRVMLSVSILGVISQILLNRVDAKGKVAAFELMLATTSIQNLIRERKTYRIISEIQTGGKMGMITMDTFLINLFKEGKITYEDVMIHANDAVSTKAELLAQGLVDEALAVEIEEKLKDTK